MGVDVALTTDENNALAGPSEPCVYAVYDTYAGANIVATAQVNGTPTNPTMLIPVDNTSADWLDVGEGMVVLIGSTAGAFDIGIYRARKTATPTEIEINQVDDLDPGLLVVADRRTKISDNKHITVLRSLDIFGVFPVIDYPGSGLTATIYENTATPYLTFNEFPPPIINITIDGRPANFATHLYAGTSYTFDIDVEFLLWPTTTDITWSILLPAGITLNSGSLSGTALTATINVTATHSADPHTIRVVAVEDHGERSYAYRKIWIKSNTYPPLKIVKATRTEDTTGAKMSLTFNELPVILPGAMWHFFDMGTWNGEDVPSASKCVTGYAIKRKEATDATATTVTLDIVGPSYLLGLIGAQSQVWDVVEQPVNFQEIVAELSYLDFILWWIAFIRVSGLTQMFNWTSFGLTNTQKRMSTWRVDGGTVLGQLQALAKRYVGGNFGCDATGEVMLRRWYSMLRWEGVDERSSVPVRCSLTVSKFSRAETNVELRPQVRHIRGEAFISDAVTDTPNWSDAPSVPGQGHGEEKFDKLVCDDTDELYEGAGNKYADSNNPMPNGTVTINKNYAVIKPAQMLPINLTIAADNRFDSVEWSGLVQPLQVQYTYNEDGTVDTQITPKQITAGLKGKYAEIPTPDPTRYNSPYMAIPFSRVPAWRSANPNPAGTSAGAKPKTTSQVNCFCGSASKAYFGMNIAGTPRYKDVTPTLGGSYQIKHGTVIPGKGRVYVVESDGTNSKIMTLPDITSPTAVLTAGASFAGVYTLVRRTNVTGSVMVYTPDNTASQTICNFVTSDHSWFVPPGNVGVYTPSSGWTDTVLFAFGAYRRGTTIEFSVTGTLVAFEATYERTDGIGASAACTDLLFYDGNVGNVLACRTSQGNGTYTLLFAGSQVIASNIGININVGNDAGGDPGGTVRLTSAKFTFSTGGGTNVRLSTDNGATVGATVTVGTSPGAVGGFDTQHTGTNSFAAADGEIVRATTLGGAYSSYYTITGSAQCVCIVVPFNKWDGSDNTAATHPDIVIALNALDGSSRSLLWIEGGASAGTVHDLTPVAGMIFNSANCVTLWKNKHIEAVGQVSSVTKCYTTINKGSVWTLRGTVSGATHTMVQRLQNTPGRITLVGSGFKFTSDFANTLTEKTKPSTADLLFMEMLG